MRLTNRLRARVGVALAVSMIVVAMAAAQNAVASGPVFTVVAQSGLYVRAEPNRDAVPLKLLPYLSQIKQMDCQLRLGSELWDKVSFDDLDQPGWVLDSFVFPSNDPQFNGLVPRCDRPPTGQITTPTSGSEVKPDSKILVTGEFEDDRGIEGVEFFVSPDVATGWVSIGRATKAANGTYTRQWTVSYPLRTRLAFAVTITDTGGNVVPLIGHTTGVLVTDRDQLPQGVMTSPAAGAHAFYGRPVTVAANVSDDGPLASVSFYVRAPLEEWKLIATDDTTDDDSFSVEWTPTFDAYPPGTLVAFKAVPLGVSGQTIDIAGANNVVVSQVKTKRSVAMRLVRFDGDVFGAMGRVTVANGVISCRRGVIVRIETWAENEWKFAGRAVTARNGMFKVRLKRDYTSTFRAVLHQLTKTDGNVCLPATSKKTHFGGGRSGKAGGS